MEFKSGIFINGRWREGTRKLEVRNPFSGEVLASVHQASSKEVEEAIDAASSTFPSFSRLPAWRRAEILREAAEFLRRHEDELSLLITREVGKPLKLSRAEVGRAVQTLRICAEEAVRIKGETVPLDAVPGFERKRGFFIRQPVGIVAAITPFNFPLNLVVHKVGPALAAGNTVILKPSSSAPLTAAFLVQAFQEAGLPPGALNLIAGSGEELSEALFRDRRVRLLTFTGSARVGRKIKEKTGLKKVILELGSNSGAIVFSDCDLELAVSRCLYGAFAFSGQICIHTQRIYVEKEIKDAFLSLFLEGVRKLRAGNPEEDCDIVPLIDEGAARRAEEWIAEAASSGAQVLCGGRREGNFIEPTVLTRTRPEMKVVCEEVFAPVVVVEEFEGMEEAVEKYNAGSSAGSFDFGLSAGVFTGDLKRAFWVAERLEVGSVHINEAATFRADHMPFGGVKESGMGREGPRFAIEEMTDIKMISFDVGE